MPKLLLMTDPHLTAPPETIIGLDPAARLAEALAHAAARHPDAARLILLGDLTNRGQPAAYAQLARCLAGAPWPVSMLMGNHDDRAAFAAQFPDHPRDPNGFFQQVIELGDARLILLDTLDDTREVPEAGLLCQRRLDWLGDRLAEGEGRPVLLFLHHPPFTTGFRGMDGIGLRNADALLALLRGHAIAHVFAGHIHRTITATVGGLSMTVFKSTCHQMPMLLGQDGFGHSVPEPGAYGIVLTDGPDVVVHFEDFTLPPAPVADFRDAAPPLPPLPIA